MAARGYTPDKVRELQSRCMKAKPQRSIGFGVCMGVQNRCAEAHGSACGQ